jgi:hypothetical protein
MHHRPPDFYILRKEESLMSNTTENSPLDVCRVIGIALLADNKVDDREIEALIAMHVGNALGVSPAEFRTVVQDLCKGAIIGESGGVNLSITDPDTVFDMAALLGRDTPADAEAVKHLVDLIKGEDPTLLGEKLLDRGNLDAALDRITDPRLQLWTSHVLVRLVNADKDLDANEKLLVSYVLNRWGISPESLTS